MPQIIQNEKGGKIIWDKDDFMNGLANNHSSSTTPTVLGGNKLNSMRSINPFRKLGVPLPGYRPTAATNSSVVSEFLRKGIVNGTSVYIISNGAKIHQFDGTNTITNSGNFPYSITAHGGHSTPVGNDCVAYNTNISSTPTLRYFYSWTDNTDWDVGMSDFAFASPNDDFMSTIPASALNTTTYAAGKDYPHPLIVGDDDILYIGDRNFLHAFDGRTGTDGTFTAAVLTLPYGWIITSFEKTDDGLMIFAYYSTVTNDNYRGQTRAFLWKYNENDITRSYNLNDNFTSESFTWGNTIGIFTSGRATDPQNTSKKSKIQLFDGTKFIPTVSFIGTIPIRGGVEVQGDSVTWNSDGVVFCYGSKTLGEKSGLNKIAATTNGTSTGMLGTFYDSNNILAVSSGATTAGGLEVMSTNFEATIGTSNCFFLTALTQPIFPTDKRGKVMQVKAVFDKTVNTSNTTELSLTLADRLNNTNLILDKHTQVTTADEICVKRTSTTTGGALMQFDALALLIFYTKASGTATESFGPIRVEVDYLNVEFT